MTTLLLVRHASACERSDWAGDDRERPLDERGLRQAEGLVELLRARGPTRILSSAYVRCRQTVEPLAEDLGVEVEEATELAEGGTAQGVRDLVMRLNAELPALCTHGDVIEELLGGESEKGSTWVLVLADGAFRPVEYLPPAPSD